MISRESVLEAAMTLPTAERARLVEDLWDTIGADALQLTPEQEKELDDAWQEHLKDPASGEDWATFKARILAGEAL